MTPRLERFGNVWLNWLRVSKSKNGNGMKKSLLVGYRDKESDEDYFQV